MKEKQNSAISTELKLAKGQYRRSMSEIEDDMQMSHTDKVQMLQQNILDQVIISTPVKAER